MKHRDVLIYTLSHPITKEIFYIGRTTMPLAQRLVCHVTTRHSGNDALSAHIRDIVMSHKTRPLIEEIDRTDYGNRRVVEEYWIQQFAVWGFALLNRRHYRVRNYQRPTEKVKKTIKLTPEEYEMIGLLRTSGDCVFLAERLGVSKERARQLVIGHTSLPIKYKDEIIDFYKRKARRIAQWYHKIVA